MKPTVGRFRPYLVIVRLGEVLVLFKGLLSLHNDGVGEVVGPINSGRERFQGNLQLLHNLHGIRSGGVHLVK